MQAKYRTSEGDWSVMEKPLIVVEEYEAGFRLTGYRSEQDVHIGIPLEGVADVYQFEVFYDNDED